MLFLQACRLCRFQQIQDKDSKKKRGGQMNVGFARAEGRQMPV
jgi:hypothetical protein